MYGDVVLSKLVLYAEEVIEFRELKKEAFEMTSIRNKERPFRILKYLYENTDEDHRVSTAELVKIFMAEDAHANRKTVKDDIDILVGEGVDVVTVRSRNHSFFLRNRKFEVPEIRLLIDAVSSSAFISAEKSAKLISKLTGMMSRHRADKISRHLYTPNRIGTDAEGIYHIVDVIGDAISDRKKVRFRCFSYNGSKERYLLHDGAGCTASPYALVWGDNHYYMIGYSDTEQTISDYRVDRMCCFGVTEEEAVLLPDDFNMDDYVRQQFHGFAGGETEVILECRDDMMEFIIDRFGEEAETRKTSEDAFRAKVHVAVSPAFFGWLFRSEGRIRIVEPEEVREKYRAMVKEANKEFRKKREKKDE